MTTTAALTPTPTAPARSASVRRRRAWAIIGCVVAVALVSIASIVFGSRTVSIDEILRALGDPSAEGIAEAAVRSRIPRTILGLLVGAALGVSGAAMQGVTRNPLADPGLLGINMGAALAVVAGMALFGVAGFSGFIGFALIGASAAAILVYTVGSIGRGGATPLKLALAGAATAAAFGSVTTAILIPRTDIMNVFRFWQVGGIAGAGWDDILAVLPFLVVGFLVVAGSARALNALALGDDVAVSLGERVQTARLVCAGGAVALCAAATAVAGPIAFVGLVVPHLVRLLFGSDYRWIIPMSIVFGGVLLLAADVVGRVVSRPGDVEVGITMALIGAPVFIAIVRRRRIREL